MPHETKIQRWTTFTPPQSTAYAVHCGLVLHRRAYTQSGSLDELLELPSSLRLERDRSLEFSTLRIASITPSHGPSLGRLIGCCRW